MEDATILMPPSTGLSTAGDKIIQYCTCPAGQVTYNFDSCTCPLKVYAIKT